MNNLTINAINDEWYAVYVNGLLKLETKDIIRLTKLIGIKRLEGYSVSFE